MSIVKTLETYASQEKSKGYIGTLSLTEDEYNTLRDMIGEIWSLDARRSYAERGLSHMRFRWDCYWAVQDRDKRWEITKGIYDRGLNDNHIDSALKRIVGDLYGKAEQ